MLVDVLLIISQLARLHKVGAEHPVRGLCDGTKCTKQAQLLGKVEVYPRSCDVRGMGFP